MVVEQKNQVWLLSSELQVEGQEIKVRGGYGPDHGEIYKSWLKSLDFILSFLCGMLSQDPKRLLGLISSVR